MTITATVPKKGYVASGGGSFAFPFKVAQAADLSVYRNGVLLTTGVAITGLGDPNGGVVTITPTPAIGDAIWLVRTTVRAQGTDWTANDPDPAESKENAFDKAMSIDQEQDELLVRIPSFAFDNGNILSPKIDTPVPGSFAQAKDNLGNIGWATPVPSGSLSNPVSFAQGGTSGAYANANALAQGLGLELGKTGAALTAAATLTLPNPLDGSLLPVSGNTGISGMSTAGVVPGTVVRLQFLGAPLLTHSVSFSLLGGVNYQVTATEILTFMLLGTNWVELGRLTTPTPGFWATPVYNAGNFTASGAMTWTVEAGDVVTYQYMLVNKTMFLNFYITASSVGGTPSGALQLTIPAGKVPAKNSVALIRAVDNGAAALGIAILSAGSNIIALRRDVAAGTNWSAATNATEVNGQLTFEIQ